MTSTLMISRPGDQNTALLESFKHHHIGFEGAPFLGFISPTSTVIQETSVKAIKEQVTAINAWNEGVLDVYRDLINDPSTDGPMLDMLEWGIEGNARRLQRESCLRRDRPRVGRLDCVSLGIHRAIAEVQWKGAGEAWNAAIDQSYREIFPLRWNHRPLGNLVEAWANTFPKDGCTVNTGRIGWLDSESFLVDALHNRGIAFLFCPNTQVRTFLEVVHGRLAVHHRGAKLPLKYLYLDRLTEALEPGLVSLLVKMYRKNELVLDPPPSYIYNQKLPMALPFLDRYAAYFDDNIRLALIPTTVISNQRPQTSPLIPFIRHPQRSRLKCLNSWADLRSLPKSLLNQLVAKCASASRYDNHGGHGVFRLGGLNESGQTALDFVLERVQASGEPWVIQPFLGNQWKVPIALQSSPNTMVLATLFAKFAVYFRLGDEPEAEASLMGGCTTLSTSWKVSGGAKTRSYADAEGNLHGALRHDIRVEVGS